jgi:hypothetical protein
VGGRLNRVAEIAMNYVMWALVLRLSSLSRPMATELRRIHLKLRLGITNQVNKCAK